MWGEEGWDRFSVEQRLEDGVNGGRHMQLWRESVRLGQEMRRLSIAGSER